MSRARMWTRIDSSTVRDPSIARLSRSDRHLYTEMLIWANEQQTDGFIERAVLKQITDVSRPMQAAQRLEDSGALTGVDNGWTIVRFFDDQLSSEEVTKRSEMSRATTERNRRHRGGDHTKCDPGRCRALLAVTRHDREHYTKLDVTSLNETILDETLRDETTVREVDVDVKFEASANGREKPPLDRNRLAFGHHPDTSAPGGATGPEDALLSAPAVAGMGVDTAGAVMPAESKSDDVSGAEGSRMPGRGDDGAARDLLDLKFSERRAVLRASKGLYRSWQRGDRSAAVTDAVRITNLFADRLKYIPGVDVTQANEPWPVTVDFRDESDMQHIEHNMTYELNSVAADVANGEI